MGKSFLSGGSFVLDIDGREELSTGLGMVFIDCFIRTRYSSIFQIQSLISTRSYSTPFSATTLPTHSQCRHLARLLFRPSHDCARNAAKGAVAGGSSGCYSVYILARIAHQLSPQGTSMQGWPGWWVIVGLLESRGWRYWLGCMFGLV